MIHIFKAKNLLLDLKQVICSVTTRPSMAFMEQPLPQPSCTEYWPVRLAILCSSPLSECCHLYASSMEAIECHFEYTKAILIH